MNSVYQLSEVEDSPRIFVAQPNMGMISPCHVVNLFEEAKDHTLYYFAPERYVPHDRARNLCVKTFLESPCDYILWLDDNSYLDGPCLSRWLWFDREYIAGVFQTIKPGLEKTGAYLVPTCMVTREGHYHPVYSGFIHEVEVAPLACALIKREVMEAIDPPAFSWGDTCDEWGIEGIGEDVYFCQKVRAAGFKIWADYVNLGHHWIDVDTLALNKMMHRAERRQLRNLILDGADKGAAIEQIAKSVVKQLEKER